MLSGCLRCRAAAQATRASTRTAGQAPCKRALLVYPKSRRCSQQPHWRRAWRARQHAEAVGGVETDTAAGFQGMTHRLGRHGADNELRFADRELAREDGLQ